MRPSTNQRLAVLEKEIRTLKCQLAALLTKLTAPQPRGLSPAQQREAAQLRTQGCTIPAIAARLRKSRHSIRWFFRSAKGRKAASASGKDKTVR